MTAAAAKNDQRKDDDPAAVVIAENVTETVIHKKSSLIVERSTLPHYHCMRKSSKRVEKYQFAAFNFALASRITARASQSASGDSIRVADSIGQKPSPARFLIAGTQVS